jgi:drug/metabolite transporter (DMT)-like permease
LEIGAVRFLGGAAVAFAMARGRGESLAITDQRTAWLRSGFGTLNAVAVFYVLGSSRIAVGDVATLSATGPLFVAMLSFPLIRERVPRMVAVGAAIGFGGVAVLVRPALHTAGDLALITVAGAFCYSIAMLSLRRLGPRETSEGIALHVSLVAGVVLLLVSLPHFVMPNRHAVVPLVVSALAGGFGQVVMSRAYALDRAARLSAFAYAGVVITYALEAVVWGKVPGPHQWLGAALVCLAGVVVASRGRSGARAATGPVASS